jgi:hypothetical protein
MVASTREKMFSAPIITYIAWALTTLLEIVLLIYAVRRKLYLSHPAFVIYIACAILQSALAFIVYRFWGQETVLGWSIVWGSQALLIFARSMAIVEIVRRNLSNYTGIWALAKRILLFVGISSLVYSLLLSKMQWHLLVVNLDRSIELSIAIVIVTFLLFARYYGLTVHSLDRLLVTGFCLYSCVFVINNSLFEKWMDQYLSFWNFLDVLAFLATLLLWMKAVHEHVRERAPEQAPAGVASNYLDLSTNLNPRLRLFNKQLEQLLRPRKTRQ